MKTMEYVSHGYRFRWAGGSFIAAHRVEASTNDVPDVITEIPDWINAARITQEVFEILCDLAANGNI